MENVITVKITPEDRIGYDFEAPQGCPLAKALAKMYPKEAIFVFDDKVKIGVTKYSFSDKAYNEKVVKKAKSDITIVLNKIMTNGNAKADDKKVGKPERIQ